MTTQKISLSLNKYQGLKTVTPSCVSKFFKLTNDSNNQAILSDLSNAVTKSHYLSVGKWLVEKAEDLKLKNDGKIKSVTKTIMRDELGFSDYLIDCGRHYFSDCRVLYKNHSVLSKAIDDGLLTNLGTLSSVTKTIRGIVNKQNKVETDKQTETETETGEAKPTGNALSLDEVQMIVGGFKKLPENIQIKVMKEIIKNSKDINDQISKFIIAERTVKPVVKKTTPKTVPATK